MKLFKCSIYLIAFVTLLNFSCTKKVDQIIEDVPPVTSEQESGVAVLFKQMGLRPSEIEKISFVKFFNKESFVFAIGQKNHNAWIAKFDKQGEEIYSKEYPISYNGISRSVLMEFHLPEKEKHSSTKYDLSSAADLFFPIRVVTNRKYKNGSEDLSDANFIDSSYTSKLAINLLDGKIVYEYKKPFTPGHMTDNNLPLRTNGGYVIADKDQLLALSDIGILWERDKTNIEKASSNFVDSYPNFLLIDTERILTTNHNLRKPVTSVLNLRTSNVERKIDEKDIPFLENDEDYINLNQYDHYIQDQTIFYEYYKNKFDTLTNTFYKVDTFYYKIDAKTFSISERFKK